MTKWSDSSMMWRESTATPSARAFHVLLPGHPFHPCAGTAFVEHAEGTYLNQNPAIGTPARTIACRCKNTAHTAA
eukprot:551033-Ditylum_brightwellii.AAC.1